MEKHTKIDRSDATSVVRFIGFVTTETGFRVSTPGASDVRRDDTDPRRNWDPMPRLSGRLFIPGSNIRGRLRHLAASWLFDQYRAAGGRISLEDWWLGTLGGVRCAKDDDEKSVVSDQVEFYKAMELKKANPLVALFGAGEPWATGAAIIGHGLDKSESGVASDMISIVRRENVFSPTGTGFGYLDEAEITNWAERREAATAEAKEKADARKILREVKSGRRTATEEEQQQARDALNTKRSNVDVRHLGAQFEIIPPGTKLDHTMVLDRVTSDEIGVFLQALARFAESPTLGAQIARGLGTVSMSYDVQVREGRGFDATWRSVDKISIGVNGINRPESPVLLDALRAAAAKFEIGAGSKAA